MITALNYLQHAHDKKGLLRKNRIDMTSAVKHHSQLFFTLRMNDFTNYQQTYSILLAESERYQEAERPLEAPTQVDHLQSPDPLLQNREHSVVEAY